MREGLKVTRSPKRSAHFCLETCNPLDDPNVNLMYCQDSGDFGGSTWSTASMFKELRPKNADMGMVALWSHPSRGNNVIKKNALVLDPVLFSLVFWNRDIASTIYDMSRDVARRHNQAVVAGDLKEQSFVIQDSLSVGPRVNTVEGEFASAYEVSLQATNFAFTKRCPTTEQMTPSDTLVQLRLFYYPDGGALQPDQLAQKPLRASTNAYYAYVETWTTMASSGQLREFLASLLLLLKTDPKNVPALSQVMTAEELNASSVPELLRLRFGDQTGA